MAKAIKIRRAHQHGHHWFQKWACTDDININYVYTWHQRWQNVKVPEEFPELPRSYAFFPAGGSVVTYYLDSTKSRCYSTKHPLRSNHKGYGAGIFLMFGLKIKKDIINNLNNHKILNHLKKQRNTFNTEADDPSKVRKNHVFGTEGTENKDFSFSFRVFFMLCSGCSFFFCCGQSW